MWDIHFHWFLFEKHPNSHLYSCPHTFLPTFSRCVCVYKSPCHVFDLPLMKALDWAETSGKFFDFRYQSPILASEVLNSQSCPHLATQRFSEWNEIWNKGCSIVRGCYCNYECLMKVLHMWGSVPSSLFMGFTSLWMAQESRRHLLEVWGQEWLC